MQFLDFFPAPDTYDRWFTTNLEYGPIWLPIFALIMAFMYGSCIGSFLNVCIWRIPRRESIVFAPSHCPKCQNHLAWYDNFPIWGYLHLRGKCRHCHEPISKRYIIMELLVGVIFTAILLKTGLNEEPFMVLFRYAPMAMLIITTYFIDRRYRIIPDATTYPAMIFGVLISFVVPSIWGLKSMWVSGLYSLSSALFFGITLGLFAIIGRKIYGNDVLGWGDVKYMMAAGALLGISGGLFTLLFGSLAGLCYGIYRAKRRKRSLRNVSIALGPCLAIGSLLWILIFI